MGKTTADILLTDEVWIAMALLHREHPKAVDFSLQEIEARLEREALTEKRPGVPVHISAHCVANKPKDRGRYRILFETAPRRRRLFRRGDPYHPSREGGKMMPARAEIPAAYHELLDWYEREWSPAPSGDPLLGLAERHREIWRGVDPDSYVRELREGWE